MSEHYRIGSSTETDPNKILWGPVQETYEPNAFVLIAEKQKELKEVQALNAALEARNKRLKEKLLKVSMLNGEYQQYTQKLIAGLENFKNTYESTDDTSDVFDFEDSYQQIFNVLNTPITEELLERIKLEREVYNELIDMDDLWFVSEHLRQKVRKLEEYKDAHPDE